MSAALAASEAFQKTETALGLVKAKPSKFQR
jgi:hypothetical protein